MVFLNRLFEWFDNNLAVFCIAATYATVTNIDLCKQYITDSRRVTD